MKKLYYAITIFVLFELSLRLIFGLGDPLLYYEDSNYEYFNKPNQNIKRFGSEIKTNEYGMRSEKVNHEKINILKIGDSVIHGGTLTSNKDLSSNLLTEYLKDSEIYNSDILNISTGSWGPDNAFQYIKKHGDFDSPLFILVFSSHDYFDTMNFEKIVDNHKSYPSKKPTSAIFELFDRYFFPRFNINFGEKKESKINSLLVNNNKVKNTGWEEFINYCKENEIGLWVVLHPTKKEIKNKNYSETGQKILQLLEENEIKTFNELKLGTKLDFYRDDIHYNEKGQRFLAEILKEDLIYFLKTID